MNLASVVIYFVMMLDTFIKYFTKWVEVFELSSLRMINIVIALIQMPCYRPQFLVSRIQRVILCLLKIHMLQHILLIVKVPHSCVKGITQSKMRSILTIQRSSLCLSWLVYLILLEEGVLVNDCLWYRFLYFDSFGFIPLIWIVVHFLTTDYELSS